jgi:transcription initiation factor TFIIH subunit 3
VVLENSPLSWNHLRHCGNLDAQSLIQQVGCQNSALSTHQDTCNASTLIILQVLVFLRAYSLLNDANQLAVFAVGSAGSVLLHATPGCAPYASQSGSQSDTSGAGSFFSVSGADVTDAVLQRLRQALEREAAGGAAAPAQHESALGSALSRALCFVHKYQKSGGEGEHRPRPRILCITACPDASAQYIAVMNAIFAAQRSKVAIDACKLGGEHSSFLQQAAYLTGGVYLRPPRPEALTQYLLVSLAAR